MNALLQLGTCRQFLGSSRSWTIGLEDEPAAALHAFAEAKKKAVVCLAHVTNRMARTEGDFEKGLEGGSQDALQVLGLVAREWLSNRTRLDKR